MWLCLDGGCGTVNPDSARVCTVCGSAASRVALLEAGTMVNGYEIRRFVGHGGYGVVYEAARRGSDGKVLDIALKQTSMADFRALEREISLLQRAASPNLPTYYEAFRHEGSGWLAMEFVQGQNLRELLTHAGDALGEKQVIQYMLELCAALSALHGQNPPLLHRDIKPANIRLTPQGRIKLVDFGLAKASTEMTRTAQQGATPAYASWEQATGMGSTVRSDIYSAGATLYHLLTNHYPATAVERGQSGDDPLLAAEQLNPALSREIAGVIRKAMARKPEARYASVAAFEQALRKASRTTVTGSAAREVGAPDSARAPSAPSATRAAGAASNGFFGLLNGALSGTVAGAVGGVSGWFIWSVTHPGGLAGAGERLAALEFGAALTAFFAPLSGWLVQSLFFGALLGGALGALMGLLGAGESRSPFARIVVSFFGALWAVVWGLFLTLTHLILAAIPFGLLGWVNPRFHVALTRTTPLGAVVEDLGFWAASGAIGWAIALSADRPSESDLSVRRTGFITRIALSTLFGAVALGGGGYVLWSVISGLGLREALQPEMLLTHFRSSSTLPVGLVGGFLYGLLRGPRGGQAAPPPEPARAATIPARR